MKSVIQETQYPVPVCYVRVLMLNNIPLNDNQPKYGEVDMSLVLERGESHTSGGYDSTNPHGNIHHTGIAERLDRNWIAIELSQKYVDELIIPRMKKINPLFS